MTVDVPLTTTHACVSARARCRMSPPRFLAECCKRQLNHGSFVLLYFRLFTFFLICIELVFSCTVLFVSISQVIVCDDRLQNDLYCVGWGVKLYSNQTILVRHLAGVVLAVAPCPCLSVRICHKSLLYRNGWMD